MADAAVLELARYGNEGQHPTLKPIGSPWLVTDATGYNWHHQQTLPWANARDAESFAIMFDGDDPQHVVLEQSEWHPLPNARKLAAAYNKPFQRNFRIRLHRAKTYESIAEIMDPHYDAADALQLARMVKSDPDDAHIAGDLEYYPDGCVRKGPQVWRRGQFWLSWAKAA